jgi:hypothetical protein
MKVVVLAFDIPRTKGYLRVKIWRELQKIGAENRLGSHWIIPFSQKNLADIKNIANEIKNSGGNAEIIIGKKVPYV